MKREMAQSVSAPLASGPSSVGEDVRKLMAASAAAESAILHEAQALKAKAAGVAKAH